MSFRRPVPEHFKANGRPKKAFADRERAVAFMREHPNEHRTVYRCGFCGKWHLASVKS